MSIERKLARPKSLTAIVKENIRNAIVSGNLPFGAQLSESILALRFGVSKTPVREALLQLKLEGLVDIQPQSGTFVFQPHAAQVREICRFREIIEASAMKLSIERDPAALAAQLRAALAVGRHSHNAHTASLIADAEFHGAIIENSGNGYLQAAYQLVADKIEALRARLPHEDHDVDACRDSHETIVEYVAARDIGQACDHLQAHIRSTEESYLRVLSTHRP